MRKIGIALIHVFFVFSCKSGMDVMLLGESRLAMLSADADADAGDGGGGGGIEIERCQEGDDCSPPPPPPSCDSCCQPCQTCPVCTVSISGTFFNASSSSIGATVALSTNASHSGYTFFTTTSAIDPEHASAIGVLSGYDAASGRVRVIVSGDVLLSTWQWDAWADPFVGSRGGLATGSEYFVSGPAGTITPIRPSYPGFYAAKIGVALSSTTMRLTTPAIPSLNP